MFEKTEPLIPAHFDRNSAEDAAQDAGIRPAESLRQFEWNELTARLNAARDLRMVLRNDSDLSEENNAGLADAATRYFRTKDDGKRAVNPVALWGSKASYGISSGTEDDAQSAGLHRRGMRQKATRENIDD